MTQKEFEERTKRTVKAEDYFIIERLYMATNMDKDEFCKEFQEMNNSIRPGIQQSLREISNRLGALEAQNATLKISMRKRDDTDFRNQAVKLVGEVEVVKRTIELGLPLWDEDRKCVLSIIDEQGKRIAG